jgi:hypothetical protein
MPTSSTACSRWNGWASRCRALPWIDRATDPDERARFQNAPITQAVREVARNADWRTTVRFFKEIAEQQQSEGQHMLVADLARSLGRRDLGVIVGQPPVRAATSISSTSPSR